MSSITRRGQEAIDPNGKKRPAPPLADKSYDRHIADSGAQLKWMREAGMLDVGPRRSAATALMVFARAARPDAGDSAHPVSVQQLRRGPQRGTRKEIAHLYVTESQRPAVTGVQKGPDGGVVYTASAGAAVGMGGGSGKWARDFLAGKNVEVPDWAAKRGGGGEESESDDEDDESAASSSSSEEDAPAAQMGSGAMDAVKRRRYGEAARGSAVHLKRSRATW